MGRSGCSKWRLLRLPTTRKSRSDWQRRKRPRLPPILLKTDRKKNGAIFNGQFDTRRLRSVLKGSVQHGYRIGPYVQTSHQTVAFAFAHGERNLQAAAFAANQRAVFQFHVHRLEVSVDVMRADAG